MPKLLLVFLLLSGKLFSQADTNTWVRAFPITDYIVDLSDSVKLVQVHLDEGTVIAEKQLGMLRGSYRDKHSDTVMIGIGRCHLIKGEYYYFSVNYKMSGVSPREGDLVYTITKKPEVYKGQLIRLASHYIVLQNVYEDKIFDRFSIFQKWTKADEEAALDSMVNDIRFTGNYFLQNNPGMNVKIPGGVYKDKMVLDVMKVCTRKDLTDFLDYMIVRPRLYAGREWKIAEVFATWLSSGSPTVIRG
ncbi:MAG: hypothetical protein WDN26_20050 [Chitinophagaceae bacterium]